MADKAEIDMAADIVRLKPKPRTSAQRQKAYRDRQRNAKAVTVPVTPVTPPTIAPTKPTVSWSPFASLALTVAAIGLAGVGITINAWYAHSLGASDVAGALFTGIGIAADIAALTLPCVAARLWRKRQRTAAMAGWVAWLATFLFAILAGLGFASLNISDVTLARAGRDTAAVTTARLALADAKAARDRECKVVGPFCRQQEATVVERQHELDAAMRTVADAADPQTAAAEKLAIWLSFGTLNPSAEDFAKLRLLLLALLPQLGGLILMVARTR